MAITSGDKVSASLVDAKAEDTAHVSGDKGIQILGVRNANLANLTNAEGDYSPIAVDSYGRVQTAVSQLSPGAGASNLGKAEDAAHSSGDVGVMMLGVRNDNYAAFSTNDGDYTPFVVDAAGRMSANVTGEISHDLADINAKPVKIGGRATTAVQPAVADADRTNASFDLYGRLRVAHGFQTQRVSKTVALVANTTGGVIWTPTAGKKFVITHIMLSLTVAGVVTVFDNTDASGNDILKGSFAIAGGVDQDYAAMPIESAAINQVLKYTTDATAAGFITVHGYEL